MREEEKVRGGRGKRERGRVRQGVKGEGEGGRHIRRERRADERDMKDRKGKLWEAWVSNTKVEGGEGVMDDEGIEGEGRGMSKKKGEGKRRGWRHQGRGGKRRADEGHQRQRWGGGGRPWKDFKDKEGR